MPGQNVNGSPVAGHKYTRTIDDLSEFAAESNDTYILNLDDGVVYYKDTNGAKQSPYRNEASIQQLVSASVVTPNADTDDGINVSSLSVGLTIDPPSGTPHVGQMQRYTIRDDGTSRGFTMDSIFVPGPGVTIPSDTVADNYMEIFVGWDNVDSKWVVFNIILEE